MKTDGRAAAAKKRAQDPAWRAANAAKNKKQAQDPAWLAANAAVRPEGSLRAWRRKKAGLLPLRKSASENIKAGLCGWCGERPFLPDRTRCEVCRDKNRAAAAKALRARADSEK
jgi:CelD/BcsL family acetyltransferase involved in cellulose biosynthesis